MRERGKICLVIMCIYIYRALLETDYIVNFQPKGLDCNVDVIEGIWRYICVSLMLTSLPLRIELYLYCIEREGLYESYTMK